MANDPDDTVEFEFNPDEDEEPDEGPECGTPEAATYFLLTYNDGTGVQFVEKHVCCFRHVPRPADIFPVGAQLLEIVVQDPTTRTVIRDGEAVVTVTDRETFPPPDAELELAGIDASFARP